MGIIKQLEDLNPKNLQISRNYFDLIMSGKITKISPNLAQRILQNSHFKKDQIRSMIDNGSNYRNLEMISNQNKIIIPDKNYEEEDVVEILADQFLKYKPRTNLAKLLVDIGSAMSLMSYNQNLLLYSKKNFKHLRGDIGQEDFHLHKLKNQPLDYSKFFSDPLKRTTFLTDIIAQDPYYRLIKSINIEEWGTGFKEEQTGTLSPRSLIENINYITISFKKDIPYKLKSKLRLEIATSNNELSTRKNPDLMGLKIGGNIDQINENISIPVIDWINTGIRYHKIQLPIFKFKERSIQIGYVPTQIGQSNTSNQYFPTILTQEFVSMFYNKLLISK